MTAVIPEPACPGVDRTESVVSAAQAEPRHGASMYGELKYGPAFEHFDYPVYRASGEVIGGHALKHLFSALAPPCLLWMLYRRAIKQAGPGAA